MSVLMVIVVLKMKAKENYRRDFSISQKNMSSMFIPTQINNAQQDTGRTKRGGMMGNGMMGGMMGNGMMMRNNSAVKNKTDANGNWIAPSSAKDLVNPTLKDIEAASRKGKQIFDSQCFTCHGFDGKGDGPAAVSINPKPADLTSNRIQNQKDGEIFWKITNGNPPMPSFKSGLSSKQRWETVDFIRQLDQKNK